MTNDKICINFIERLNSPSIFDVLPNKGLASHNKYHTMRVYALAEKLSSIYNLTENEKELLLTSVLYHDAGRTNDAYDVRHGAAGYAVFCKDHQTNDGVEFLVRYHSYPDDVGLAALEEREWGIPKERLLLLFKIIKDADALDRVRFGENGLDEKFLRLPVSKKLVALADELFVLSFIKSEDR